MDFTQFMNQSFISPISNNFYCNIKSSSASNSKYLKSHALRLSSPETFIAFGVPQLNFIPTRISNSFQEAVVISAVDDSNIFADVTNNWIKKHKDKNHQSLFYKKIFKALLTKKIEVTTQPIKKSKISSRVLLNQKYIWRKGWKPSISSSNASTRNSRNISNVSKKFLMDQLSASPVFVVKNGFNEIVLGHPVSRIKRSGFEHISSFYSNILQSPKSTSPVSNGFFFFHPDDAAEFKNFIRSTNPIAATQMEIQVEPVGLHFAYKMNRNLLSDTQFLFIPDFKEVGDLIFKFQKDKHLVFHKDQYYGKDFFQGQPVYMIQPVNVKGRNGQLDLIKFSGLNDNREVVFTNREAANKSWTNFINNKPNLKSIKKPTLLVYNLESFLKDRELQRKEDLKKFVVVTNKEAYSITKELTTVPDSNSLSKHLKLNIRPKLFFVKLWVRRLLSTLTYE